ATLTFSELKLGVHLIVHPVIRFKRNSQGKLTAVYREKKEGRGMEQGQAESVMQFQVDRKTRPEDLEKIESRLKAAFNDVHRAVSDWGEIKQRARDANRKMPDWAPHVDQNLMRESREFMHWLMADNFIFLGVRDYVVERRNNRYQLKLVTGSGLGILRETEKTVTSRPLSSLAVEARKRQNITPLIITKTNARSTIHRAGYLDYIGVLQINEQGRTIGERRFLGLFTSQAYRVNAMDTPLVRVRAQRVMDSVVLHQGGHAWKSMVHILESLPRDTLFQANFEELKEIAIGVLNLQERSRVRLFIRQERFGRFWTCLVYIPRERFNTENREAIQSILYRALKGERLDYEPTARRRRSRWRGSSAYRSGRWRKPSRCRPDPG
ncbi:MAG: hypothetical protein ACE1Y4_06470, partial [Lysobacterales bacterium]